MEKATCHRWSFDTGFGGRSADGSSEAASLVARADQSAIGASADSGRSRAIAGGLASVVWCPRLEVGRRSGFGASEDRIDRHGVDAFFFADQLPAARNDHVAGCGCGGGCPSGNDESRGGDQAIVAGDGQAGAGR